jgi:hypothetical protein
MVGLTEERKSLKPREQKYNLSFQVQINSPFLRSYNLKIRYLPIFALVGLLAVMSGMPLLLSTGSVSNYAYARYATNIQNQANSNECNTGTSCAITSPQTQGDGTANSPVNTQISNFNEEEETPIGDSPIGDLPTVFVTVQNCIPEDNLQTAVNCDVIAPPEWAGRPLSCQIAGPLGSTSYLCTVEPRPTDTLLFCNFFMGRFPFDPAEVIPCLRIDLPPE